MMNDSATVDSPLNSTNNPDNGASDEAVVDHYLTAIKRLQLHMAADREEILRLQAETRAILDDVMATLKTA